MDKYSYRYAQKDDPNKGKIHPIWRGIGCLLLILIPLLAYAGSQVLIDAAAQNDWFVVPVELRGPAGFPFTYAELMGTVLLSMIGFGVAVILYSFIYRFIGPPKYGPTDAPPPKRVKSRRR